MRDQGGFGMETNQDQINTVKVSFRPMRLEDIPGVCEIEVEAFTTPWSAGAFHNELTNNHFAKYIIMETGDGEMIGYAGMWMIMDEAHVTNIAIKSEYRGQKLGERLMLKLVASAKVLGAVRMTLEVRTSNQIAQQLYEKMGFKASGVRRGYYTDNNEDAIIMWAELA
jgi:ribosomal-protein-alanine N-acetyltransferase